MGLHLSQIAAVRTMVRVFVERQERLLAQLRPSLAEDTFAQRRLDLDRELVGAHGVLGVFRYILAQRRSQRYFRRTLVAADLISARCYLDSMELAHSWGAIPRFRFREPPLTYLNAGLSPAAMTRRHCFGKFDMPVEGKSEEKLPISLISLPFAHAAAIWNLCSVYHEVGHPLDQDLGLAPAIASLLQARLADAKVPPERVSLWAATWARELVADTIGVLLGGAGFAYAIENLLFLPASDALAVNPGARHPNHYVRVFLLAALLRRTAVPALTVVADEMEDRCLRHYGKPESLLPYCDDCPQVADVLLHSELAPLNGRRLCDIAPSLNRDEERTRELARYFATGFETRGVDPKHFPARLVPAGAQLAFRSIDRRQETSSRGIHRRATEFLERIPPPCLLTQDAPESARERAQYLRELAESFQFSSPGDAAPG
jgi:hypothetical protein